MALFESLPCSLCSDIEIGFLTYIESESDKIVACRCFCRLGCWVLTVYVRNFQSVNSVIGCLDILNLNCRLQYPVPPAEPVNDKKRMVAILPYTKMPDTDEITFQKGNLFEKGGIFGC